MTQDPMTDNADKPVRRPAADGNTISPLPGEPGIPNVASGSASRCRGRGCWPCSC
jgi:hypothetical protein